MGRPRDDNASAALGTAALLLLVAIALGRVASHEFVNFDDDKFIYANEKLLPPTAASLAQLWGEQHAHLYVPVTMSAWWLIAQAALVHDRAAAGGFALNPWVFHAASLLVHAANVLLVRRLVRSLARDDVAAVLGAAVFAVHPLQAETVAWASELKDLLAAMFALLALIAILRATDGAPTSVSSRPRRGRAEGGTTEALPPDLPAGKRHWAWWFAAAACFVLALLSKPAAVTLPLIAAAVLWATHASPPPLPRRTILLVLLVGLVLAAPVALITKHVQPAADVPAPAIWARPLVAADAVAFYLGKVVAPLNLAVDYGRTPAAIFATNTAYWTWLAPLAVTIAVLLSRQRLLIAAWLIFLAAPAANLGLVPFDFQIVSTVADHYVYLALLGVALAVAWLVTRWPRLRAAVVAVVVILGVLTFIQAGRWRDSQTLWRHALNVNRDSGLAHVNLGVIHLRDGRAADALPLLIRAAAIDPHDPFAQLNLIGAYLATGQTAAAADACDGLVAAYRRRADFNPPLVAAVLDRFGATIAARGDATSAQRVADLAARVRNPQEK